MDCHNAVGVSRWLRNGWLVVGTLVVATSVSVVAFAQDNKDVTPSDVANPGFDITPKPFGRPLVIESGSKEIRTVWMYEGRSTIDQRDPARVVYYHGLDLALVPNEKPLPGFPDWVQDVTQRDDDTIIEIAFQLSSPKLRRACEAKLLSDMRDYFDRERDRLKVPSLKVEVQKIPAWELFIAIQDSASKLTMSYDIQHIVNLGEEVSMKFRFKPEDLSLFMRVAKEGKLQFKPYYKVRADQIITGEKQTTIAYDVGLKVKQLLNHQQRSKQKADDENTIHPILQDDVNRITRQVTMDIKSRTTVSDPNVITFLHNDTMLVASCFDPANTINYADFRRAFPDFTDVMLAEYLKPYGVTKVNRTERQDEKGTQHTDEKTKQIGGGLGFSIAVGPVSVGGSGSKESAERVLDTIYNATGVRLVDGGSENYYKAAEIKVFKLAEGYEEKKLGQASSITLTKGSMNSYLEESPFPQSYLAGVVINSQVKTLSENDHVARLLTKKAELEEARKKEQKRIAAAVAEQLRAIEGVDKLPLELDGHATVIPGNISESQRENWMRGMYGMIKAVWSWQPPEGMDKQIEIHMTAPRDDMIPGTRRDRTLEAQRTIENSLAAIKSKASSIGTALNVSKSQNDTIAKALAEISRLQTEIDATTKELFTILER